MTNTTEGCRKIPLNINKYSYFELINKNLDFLNKDKKKMRKSKKVASVVSKKREKYWTINKANSFKLYI